MLQGWREALVPDGRIWEGFFVAETLPELRGLLADGYQPVKWRTPSVWREAFAAAGLSIFRDAPMRATWTFFRVEAELANDALGRKLL